MDATEGHVSKEPRKFKFLWKRLFVIVPFVIFGLYAFSTFYTRFYIRGAWFTALAVGAIYLLCYIGIAIPLSNGDGLVIWRNVLHGIGIGLVSMGIVCIFVGWGYLFGIGYLLPIAVTVTHLFARD